MGGAAKFSVCMKPHFGERSIRLWYVACTTWQVEPRSRTHIFNLTATACTVKRCVVKLVRYCARNNFLPLGHCETLDMTGIILQFGKTLQGRAAARRAVYGQLLPGSFE